eukprot:54872_1
MAEQEEEPYIPKTGKLNKPPPKLTRRVSTASIHDQLKVFLIGSRRTGTVTLTSLLEEIGYGTKYHGWTFWWYRNRDLSFWESVLEKEGKDVEWDELFIKHGPFHVTSDEPSILFWRSLVEYYPQMKCILTIRAGDKWFKSYKNAIIRTVTNPVIFNVAVRLKYFVPGAVRYFNIFRYGIIKTFKEYQGPNAFNKEYAINEFNRRNNEIKKYFKDNNEMKRFLIIDWDRKDKNKMFLELMQFLDIKLTK